MSKERTIEVNYYENDNKRCEIPLLNGKWNGLFRWWHDNSQLQIKANYKNNQKHGLRLLWLEDGSIYYFDFWHKGTLVFELKFKEEAKALTPEPNKPIFSTNQFLKLCQRKEQ